MANMSPTAAAPPPSLSFPRATFAKLSPHPYLLAHLQPPSSSTSSTSSARSTRANARSPGEARIPHINTGSLTHAEGSAVVRLGDTAVVCGVRGEILLASDVGNGYRVDKISEEGGIGDAGIYEPEVLSLLVPNIELATGCSPAFLPGQPPSTLAQSLSTRIYSLLHSTRLIDHEDLRIWYKPPNPSKATPSSSSSSSGDKMDKDDSDESGPSEERMEAEEGTDGPRKEIKAFWTLYIDILFISLDGNPFDAAWAAVYAALRDVHLPHAYWDVDREFILCDDEISKSKRLSLREMPVASTFTVFLERERGQSQAQAGTSGTKGGQKQKSWILTDPDTFEEGLCDESVTVTVDCSGKNRGTRILGISKSGGVVVGREEMRSIVQMAESRWGEWYEAFESAGKT